MPDDNVTDLRSRPPRARARAQRAAPPAPAAPAEPAQPPARPPSRAVGRPSRMNDHVIDMLCGALATGVSIRDAAVVAGVSEQIVHNWKRQGQQALATVGLDVDGMEYDADEALAAVPEKDRRYVEFLWRFQVADARGVAELAAKVHRTSDPRVQLTLLKMRRPDEFSERLDINVGGTIEVADARGILAERFQRLRETIETTATDDGAGDALPARKRAT